MCESFQSATIGPMIVPTSEAVSRARPLLRRRTIVMDGFFLFFTCYSTMVFSHRNLWLLTNLVGQRQHTAVLMVPPVSV
jgi:hypothetical protein